MADEPPFRYAKADDSAGFLFWQVSGLWQQKLAGIFGALGITQTQYAILASLRWFEAQGEPSTQAHLARHARIEKMTLSKAIRRLEAQGLVLRQDHADDQRAWDLSLSSAGRRLVARAVRQVEQADEDFFGAIGPRQLAAFRQLMVALVAKNAP